MFINFKNNDNIYDIVLKTKYIKYKFKNLEIFKFK